MKATRLVEIATSSILKNKMRTLLTMLGIIIGVGAVIVMVAVGQGAKSEIQRRIDNLGTNMIVVTQGATRQGGVSQGAGTSGRLTVDDYLALKREGLLLSQVSPVVVAPSQVIGNGTNWRSLVNGVSLDYQTIRAWTIALGRYFDQNDLQTRRKVAVIGKTVADNLFPGQDPVGAQIRIRNEPFQIIGVLAPKGKGRTLVMGVHLGLLLSCCGLLGIGVAAFVAGQPWGVWYWLGFPGLLGVVTFGPLTWVVRWQYTQAELRKSMGEDL